MIRITFILISLLPIVIGSKAKWSYEEPDHWLKFRGNRYCGGHLQSPINIQNNVSLYDRRFRKLAFETYGSDSPLELVNNGHTAQLNLFGSYILKNVAPYTEDYKVEQLHFHWGHDHDNTNGSEHLLDGQSFPLEMHIVTYSSDYDSIKEAMSNIRGLAVVGFFFQLSDVPNPFLQPIIDGLAKIHQPDTRTSLETDFDLKGLVGEDRTRFYYRYDGSLTTPPCFESVMWSVIVDPIEISIGQLRAFRRLHDVHEKPLQNNFRPIQPLGSRKLLRSFFDKDQPNEFDAKYFGEASGATRLFANVLSSTFIFASIRAFF